MKTTMTQMAVTVGTALLVVVGAATIVKSQETIRVGDEFFNPKSEKLQQAPPNVAVVQPTHFPDEAGKIKHVYEGESLARTVGRNVTFRDLIAEAYDCEPGCVVLPLDAPKGGFDFLVTVSPKTRKHLRDAIQSQLGYVATSEMREAEVMVLQVKDSSLPGLTISSASDNDINYKDGKLYFVDQPMGLMVKGLEEGLGVPVVDKTGLTNNYDFSVTWNSKATQAMRDGGFSFDGTEKVLGGWGLELKSDTAKLEMFTVKKVR